MKKILVLGVYYSCNLGDGVICQCVAARLKHHFPDAAITIADLVNRNSFSERFTATIEELLKRRWRPRLRRIVSKYFFWDKQLRFEGLRLKDHIDHIDEILQDDWDVVVIAGGQLFMDRYSLFLEAVIQRCDQKNVPVFINACGTGPTASRKIRSRLAAAMNKSCVKLISSRDDAEQVRNLYLKGSKNVISTYDPALWTREIYGIEKKTQTKTIGLGFMYVESRPTKAVLRFWKNLILELEKRQLDWKIFVNGSGDDVTFAKYVLSHIPELKQPAENYMVPVPHTPIELVQTISGFHSIISFRLHSHIIAASLGIPSIALVWNSKVRFFFKKIGYGWRCCTVYASAKRVLNKLEKAEQVGYDSQVLLQQKQYADSLLYEAILKEIEGTQRNYEQNT